ncbi:MAG: DUF6438 domain-containing protein [Pyrinomonadaceae bacterium]
MLSGFAGCSFAPPVEDISEVALGAHTGLSGSSFLISFRGDGIARCECAFYLLNQDNKPKIPNPEPLCAELYRSNSSAFVKTENKLEGNFSGVITKEQFDRLAQLINKNGFFSMQDKYIEKGVHDAPPTFTKVVYDGKTKEVSDNLGKGGEKLSEIKRAIKQTAEEIKWVSAQK